MTFTAKHTFYLTLITLVIMVNVSCEKKSDTSNPKTTYELLSVSKSTSSKLFSDKVTFEYNSSDQTLIINHKNAAFSYCSKIKLDISFRNNEIIIIEKENNANCDSLTLYNLKIKLNKLPPKKYKISIIEPYVSLSTEKIEFEIDLNNKDMGSFLVKRNFYPWGN